MEQNARGKQVIVCFVCVDGPPGTFTEQIHVRGREADEEDVAESGRSGQGEQTK